MEFLPYPPTFINARPRKTRKRQRCEHIEIERALIGTIGRWYIAVSGLRVDASDIGSGDTTYERTSGSVCPPCWMTTYNKQVFSHFIRVWRYGGEDLTRAARTGLGAVPLK